MDGTDHREGAGPGSVRRQRVFFALDPPPPALALIAAWQRRALRDRESARAIEPGALHLTLAFLGDRRDGEVERAAAVLRDLEPVGAVAFAFAAEPIGLPRRRPRVLAFEVESPAAMTLERTLAARLAAAGLLERPESRRPFRPHLSVARVRGDPRDRRSRRAALTGLPPLAGGEGHTFDAVRVALYRSELRSQGARYSALADVELPHRGGG